MMVIMMIVESNEGKAKKKKKTRLSRWLEYLKVGWGRRDSVPRISTSVSETSGVSLVSLVSLWSLQSHYYDLIVGQLIWKLPPIGFNMDGAALPGKVVLP